MGYLKSTGTTIIWMYTALLVVTFWPGLPPYGDFSEYEFVEPKALAGDLARNERLNGAVKMFEGQVAGPEAFAIFNDEVYTGLLTGEIVKVTKAGKLETVFKIGEHDEETKLYKVGRPLALKFDKKGSLYATDLVFGIFKIDLKTKKAELIIPNKTPVEGKRSTANDLDIASNGDIFWSDSCAGFEFEGTFLPIIMLNPCGRLLRYSPETKRSEVLIRNLGVANGVSLSKDESFVLVAECLLSRIVKYHLKGAKAGQHEVLIESLPGTPDNIQPDNKDGFLVSLPMYVDAEDWSYLHLLIRHSYVRKCIARLPYVLKMPFQLAHKVYPAYDPTPVLSAINHFFNSFMDAKVSAVLRMSKEGKITDAAYSTNKAIPGLSSAHIFGNELWMGSFKAQHFAKVPLKVAFPSLAK